MTAVLLPALVSCLALATGCSNATQVEAKKLIAAPTVHEAELLDDAVRAYDSGLYSVAKQVWTNLKDGYPGSYFAPLAELKAADSFYYLSDFSTALAGYEEFAHLHPGHEAMPYVRYQIASCHLGQYRGDKHDQSPLHLALTGFKALAEEYPSSEYAVLARRKIDHGRELLARHESYVAEFYLRQGLAQASAARFSRLRVEYPESGAARQAAGSLWENFPEEMASVQDELEKREGIEPVPSSQKAAPHSPRFALSLASPSRVGARGALVRLPGSPVFATVARAETPTRGLPGLALGVSCDEISGVESFTVLLGRSLTVTEEKAVDDSTFEVSAVARGNDMADLHVAELSSEAFRCELRHSRVAVRETRLSTSPSAGTLQIVVNHRSGDNPVLLELDRPRRLVVLVRSGS